MAATHTNISSTFPSSSSSSSSSSSPSSPSLASTPSPSKPSSSQRLLQSLLYTPLRITLTDSRAFIGHFICVDHAVNLILSQAEELLPPTADEDDRPLVVGAWGGREMGMVMVPKEGIRKIEAQLSESQWEDVMDGREKIEAIV